MGEHKFMLIGVAVAALALLVLVKKRVRLRMWESLSVRRRLIWLAVLSVVLHSALAIKLVSRAPVKKIWPLARRGMHRFP
ncbi:MAG: hypothetical protein RSF79_22845, partial [Janthinobacterium sp.]